MEKRIPIYNILLLILAVIICSVATYYPIIAQQINTQQNSVYAETSVQQNKIIQQRLQSLGYYSGAIDGIIGGQTVQAIKKFQFDYGVQQTGTVGPETSRLLGISLASQSSNDLYLIAKCVYAEARGEPYVGQVAVAAVILNRVQSPSFPNTIYGVVYQPWAFTAVQDGQIDLEPNASAYKAAQDALNGWDQTYGCIYYYNPITATSQWIFNREIVLTIGKHAFAR